MGIDNNVLMESDLVNIENEYDIFLVGSDQVWNTEITNNSLYYYLNFVSNKVKVSYSSSVGKNELLPLEIGYVKKYLTQFDLLSCREKGTAKLLRDITDANVELVVDPVFLLDSSEWESLVLKKHVKDKFILMYCMQYNEKFNQIANKLSEEYGYKIKFISASKFADEKLDGEKLNDVGPIDFIEYIRTAEFVITNSFHGFAFSLIFRKKIFVLEHSTRNIRLENLIDLVQDGKTSTSLNNYLDGGVAYDKLYDLIESSKAYIDKIEGIRGCCE